MKHKFPFPLLATRNAFERWVVSFPYGYMEIDNATVSECGRFPVLPAYYGLTVDDAQFLMTINTMIPEIADRILNEACFDIQTYLGVTDGGFASVFFSGDGAWQEPVEMRLAQYIAAQINHEGADHE